MSAAALALLAMTLPAPPDLASLPFHPGEELVFQIKALGLKAGSAQFDVGSAEVVEDRSANYTVTQMQTEIHPNEGSIG
jgi:hypothetical protein